MNKKFSSCLLFAGVLLFSYREFSRRVLSNLDVSLDDLGIFDRTRYLMSADGQTGETFCNLINSLRMPNINESARKGRFFHGPCPNPNSVGTGHDLMFRGKDIHSLNSPTEFEVTSLIALGKTMIMRNVGMESIVATLESKGGIEIVLEPEIPCIRGSDQLPGRKIKFVGTGGI